MMTTITTEEALLEYGRWDFAVQVSRDKDGHGYIVSVYDIGCENLFKCKAGDTIVDALRSIADYHSGLARFFERDE